jgi:large subunit ribosomal protein L21
MTAGLAAEPALRTMYAVIETGGKQYRVEVGTELAVERLEAEPGESITLDRVLLVSDGDATAIGRPLVTEATVSAEVLRQDLADKVIVFKYRPKARHRSKRGHRQQQTILRVTDVTFNGRSAAKESEQATELRKTERERLEEAARRQAEADAALAAKLTAAEAKKAAPPSGGESAEPAEKPARRTRAKAAEVPAEPKTKAETAEAKSAATKKPRTTKTKSSDAAAAEGGDKPAGRTRAKKPESKDE